MAVMCESPAGWLLDELILINKWYQFGGGLRAAPSSVSQEEGHSNKRTVYKLNDELFMLIKPYISSHTSTQPVTPDNAAAASSCRLENSPHLPIKAGKKKRKRLNALNQGELDALAYHQQICDLILKGSLELIQEGLKKGLLHTFSQEEEGNCPTSSGVCVFRNGLAELCNMNKDLHFLGSQEYPVNIIGSEQPVSQDIDYLSCITENISEWPQLLHLLGEKYIIPPKTSFLLSDISCMQSLLHYKKYGIIVLDPPWENKSVKRSKRYNHLSPLEIKQLPIPALAAQNCLVVTWVTNRQKHLRFVKEDLYPHWSVRTLAEWHWVKITQSGEYVFPIESAHKKPYEILVLGRLMDANVSPAREPDPDLIPIPRHKIMVSVPCNLHSHKPPLSEVLKPYVKPDVECLELFARNLQPGWTSWGNEVLKFQHVDYFIPSETEN
ncbi:N(6)-adenine-specific methyltransferase METTL4 [Hyperolius riggenbachi]|uniref:N(6)-adenine-specific methyltransferase METTL4 n=1 Tax=Hyperolius riggenbachi TaxID=752182 RepID=UPI0035A2D15E